MADGEVKAGFTPPSVMSAFSHNRLNHGYTASRGRSEEGASGPFCEKEGEDSNAGYLIVFRWAIHSRIRV